MEIGQLWGTSLRFRLQKGFWTSAFGLSLLGFVALGVLVGAGIFTFYYIKDARMIDARLSGHVLQNSTQIFSSPARISDGQAWGVEDLIAYLQRSGYRPESDDNALGEYSVDGNVVDIKPSRLSYFGGTNDLAVQFNGRTIRAIRPLAGGYHRTMRIALHIDHETDAAGNIIPPPPGTSPAAAPSVATESAVN